MISNDLDDIYNKLINLTNEILEDNVAKKVTQIMQEEIKVDVYSYHPHIYERQYYDGGLIDPHNIKTELTDDLELTVENIRHDGDKNVALTVETGEGYDYTGYGYSYEQPRPFTEDTRQRLRKTDELRQAFKEGFNQRGEDAR